jgi:negative regulator of replication initiation
MLEMGGLSDRSTELFADLKYDVERFNNVLRQRVCRLVHKTSSFSKNTENHIGATRNFIHDDNAKLQTEYAVVEGFHFLSIFYLIELPS